jgi:hypothetical protein
MYINGTQLYNGSFPSSLTDEAHGPLPGGHLQMGVEMLSIPSQPNSLMAETSASFSIDVFRVYNRSLSAAEIAAVLWAFDPPSSAAGALLLHWRFDEPDPEVEIDLSGRDNHGAWGASASLDTPHAYRLGFTDGAVYSQVLKPGSVMSFAPVRGASVTTVQVSCICFPVNQDINNGVNFEICEGSYGYLTHAGYCMIGYFNMTLRMWSCP